MGLNYRNLHKAKAVKDNEFFTRAVDIQKELQHYWKHFKNKIILLNCNDDEDSEFWKYFKALFKVIELKKLIAISYGDNATVFEYDGKEIKRTKLQGDGDFNSNECIKYLQIADVVVTNPPFSLLREYIDQLVEFNKNFIIIGPLTAIGYKDIFAHIKNNKIWIGFSNVGMKFKTKNGIIKKLIPALWYTNLDHEKRHHKLILYKTYNSREYPKFVNYNAININRTKDIPKDYYEEMGVPISFLLKWNPEQFKIIALGKIGSINFTNNYKMEILKNGKIVMNGKDVLYIKYKDSNKKKSPKYKNIETGELYQSIFLRIIIKRRINAA